MPTINIRWADNTAQLRENLKQGVDQIEATRASAEKMAKALGGENLIRAAHNYVAAVQELGGANKLTAGEQDRVNAILEKAIAKYTALGQQAPAALLEIYEATKRAVVPVDQLAVETERLAKQLGGGAQSALAYVAAVEKLGGASKLTAAEQGQVNAVLAEAMAKYKALGQTAPAAMVALEQATRKTVQPVDQLALDVERLAKQLGGGGLSQAHAYVAAVQQIGGASKLTAAEQKTINAAVTEAIAKYKALGQTAPAAMVALAEATKKAEAPTARLSSAISGVGKDILTTAAGFLTARAAISAAEGGISLITNEIATLVMQGSAVSDVTANFERLTSQAGRLGSTLLTSLRDGTHRTIDDFSLMKLATQDLAAGLKLTDQQFGVMAKGAFALAQATGTDVKTALDTMNDAMLTGRTRSLAQLTSKIDLTAAEEKYAKSIHTTAEHLNEEGKLEAARMAILDAVSAATDRLGEQVDGLDEHVAQAKASWENFHNELAKTVAESPVLEAGFQAIEEAIAGALGSNQEERVKNVTAAIEQIAIKIPDVIDFIVSLGVEAARVFDDIERRAGGVGNAIKHIGVGATAGAAMGMFAGGVGAVPGAAIGAAVGAFMPTGSSSGGGPSDAMLAIEAAAKKSGEATALMRQRMIEARDTAASFVGPLQETAAAHTAAGAAADKHGQFTQRTKEEISKEAAELKKAAAITAEAASSMNDLSGAQVEAIRYYKDQQVSVADTAKILGIYEQQVRQVITAEADALKASKALADFRKRVAKEQAESLTEMSGAVLSNLKTQTAAEKEHWTAVAKLTMTGVQFDLAQVDQWEIDEKAKLDQRALNHKAAEDAIVQAAQDRRDEIRRLAEFEDVKIKYEFVGPVSGGPASGPTRGQQLQESLLGVLKSVPQTVAEAFQNAGDATTREVLDNVAKSIGSRFGAALGKHIGDGIKALGALGGPIGEALGSFIGPLIDKLFSIGGPSKAELAGRELAAQFEKGIADGLSDAQKTEAGGQAWKMTVIGIRDAYIAAGKTAAEAEAAVARMWAAEKQGAEAVKAVQDEINAIITRADKAKQGASQFGLSHDELIQAAQDAKDTYEYMRDSGEYTAEQIQKAFEAAQAAAAAAGDEAAKAWVESRKKSSEGMAAAEADLQASLAKRNDLAAGLAKEAKEEHEGLVETQQKEELAVLDKQIQEKADAYAKLADETGQKMADAIVEALKNIHIDPIHVPVQVDTPDTSKFPRDFPGPFTGEPREHDEGFASGTPDLGFKNFGAGRRVILHGLEAVVPIDRAQDFAARHVPALASPSLPSFQPLPTNIVPARLTSDGQQSAIGSLLSRAQVSPSTQSQDNVSVTNNYITVKAVDAPSFERLVRDHGVEVVVDRIVLGKGGHLEKLKRAGL